MKVIKRLLIILLAVMVVFIVFLAGSIVVDGVMGKSRLNSVTNTVIPGVNGGPDVRAYVAAPQGEGPFPVVIMIHEFFGLNESIIGKAQGLAEAGYLVVAPDTFRGSTTSWIPAPSTR
jgi:carboxymethylenebutenolidase